MLRFFRSLRRGFLTTGRVRGYLLYAVGEIVLVVIGILLALQINNWNDARRARDLELQYLRNIRADLVANMDEIDRFMTDRTADLKDAGVVVARIESGDLGDPDDFNRRCINVYEWRRFVQIDTTVEELISSGNFSLISSDPVKSGLLRLEAAYKENKAEEDHLRFDAEQLLYLPLYAQVDLNPMLRSFGGETGMLPPDQFDPFFRDPRFKNGFLMAILEFGKLNGQLERMREICREVIGEIDGELGRRG